MNKFYDVRTAIRTHFPHIFITMENLNPYLVSNEFSDSEHIDIINFTEKHTRKNANALTNAVALYKVIRDNFWYNPHHVSLQRIDYQASNFLKRNSGHCIDKANLLAACAKVIGIPRYRRMT